MSQSVTPWHWAFDKLYPLIRFTYETLQRHPRFDQIAPRPGVDAELWIGGAPTYVRDYNFLLKMGIRAVVNIRAERPYDVVFYDMHGITHVRYFVPDVGVPTSEIIASAVDWIAQQVADASQRGRSAS